MYSTELRLVTIFLKVVRKRKRRKKERKEEEVGGE